MARASAAMPIGYSQRMVGRPTPRRCSILSNMMRKNMSSHESPACMATPDDARQFFRVADRGEQVDAGVALERLGDGQPLRRRQGIADLVLPAQFLRAGQRQQRRAILHDRLVARTGAIPFEHGELGMMQRRALGVAEHARELEELRDAAGQQLLHRELGRAVQPARALLAVGQFPVGGEARQMHLGARRHLQDRRLDLDEALAREPQAQLALQARARLQVRQAAAELVGAPVGHVPPSHAARRACRLAR